MSMWEFYDAITAGNLDTSQHCRQGAPVCPLCYKNHKGKQCRSENFEFTYCKYAHDVLMINDIYFKNTVFYKNYWQTEKQNTVWIVNKTVELSNALIIHFNIQRITSHIDGRQTAASMLCNWNTFNSRYWQQWNKYIYIEGDTIITC